MMKASGSKHSLNKYYGATAEDVENTAGLLEMTNVLDSAQNDENVSGSDCTTNIFATRLVRTIDTENRQRRNLTRFVTVNE